MTDSKAQFTIILMLYTTIMYSLSIYLSIL